MQLTIEAATDILTSYHSVHETKSSIMCLVPRVLVKLNPYKPLPTIPHIGICIDSSTFITLIPQSNSSNSEFGPCCSQRIKGTKAKALADYMGYVQTDWKAEAQYSHCTKRS